MTDQKPSQPQPAQAAAQGQQGQKTPARQGEITPHQGRSEERGIGRMSDPLSSFAALSPFSLMRRFTEDLESLFQGGLGSDLSTPGMGSMPSMRMPRIDMYERGGQLMIKADLPGLSKDDVRVELTDDSVIIEGETGSQHEEREGDYYRSERSWGSFYREVPLPQGVKADAAEASFHNGVLEISVPMQQEQRRGRRLEVKESQPKNLGGKGPMH